jgi:NADH:ubiquinone oxidoreductase subunit 3 (subunit A)
MDASSPVRKSVAYECGVGRSTEKWLCQFPRNYLVVLLDIVLHYFISRINWVNKITNKKNN